MPLVLLDSIISFYINRIFIYKAIIAFVRDYFNLIIKREIEIKIFDLSLKNQIIVWNYTRVLETMSID